MMKITNLEYKQYMQWYYREIRKEAKRSLGENATPENIEAKMAVIRVATPRLTKEQFEKKYETPYGAESKYGVKYVKLYSEESKISRAFVNRYPSLKKQIMEYKGDSEEIKALQGLNDRELIKRLSEMDDTQVSSVYNEIEEQEDFEWISA